MINPNNLCKKLIKLRKEFIIKDEKTGVEHSATQEDIAKILNCNVSTISRYERDEIKIDYNTLVTLAKLYGTTTDYLLGVSTVRSLDIEIEKISRFTGLTEEAIKLLHELAQQQSGELLSNSCKKKIERIEKQFKGSESTSEFKDPDKNEQIEIAKAGSQSIAESQLRALNYVLSQDETQRFLSDLFLHLFAEVSDKEDIMSAIIALKSEKDPSEDETKKSKENPSENGTKIEKGFYFNLLDSQINGLFLLEINSILNKWKADPCAEIVDINTENNDWIAKSSDV